MNRNYVIITDSGCDLSYDYLDNHGIECVDLTCNFEQTGEVFKNREMGGTEFYQRMRDGLVSRTSAPNPEDFFEAFEPVLKKNLDIFYIGFDSALSTTVNSAMIAAAELREKYPERKIVCLDTLCASAGLGLVVAQTQRILEDGAEFDEAVMFAKTLCPSVSHRFTVDTLTYLCRGGRVSKTAAFAGNVLDVKPVLHVDDEGRLINIAKVRGRSKSISMLAEAFGNTALEFSSTQELAAGAESISFSVPSAGPIFISQADCMDDAVKLASLIKERYGRTVEMITDIGPVIGSHSGPGTLALFFGAERR